jgi:hypothetical protein
LKLSILHPIKTDFFLNDSGQLTVAEFPVSKYFQVNRLYYISDVPTDKFRGSHAHKSLHQAFFALKGSFKLRVTNGILVDEVLIEEKGVGYFLKPGFWRDLLDFTPGTICLVLASKKFDSADYIYTMDEYLKWRVSN